MARVVYDPVGGEWAEPVFRSMVWRGPLPVVGFAGGPIPSLPMNLPLLKGSFAGGGVLGRGCQTRAKVNAVMMQTLAQWYGQGKGEAADSPTLPMSDLKQAP